MKVGQSAAETGLRWGHKDSWRANVKVSLSFVRVVLSMKTLASVDISVIRPAFGAS